MPSSAYDLKSTSVMHIHDALALSQKLSSNTLTPGERTAMRRSDRKAEQVLGVTLTRDVKTLAAQEDVGPGHRAPLADLVSTTTDSLVDAAHNIGALMAAIGAKRSRSREFSNVTLVGALKDIGGGIMRVGRKKRRVGAMHSRRVILGPLHDLESGSDESGSSSTASESHMHSFLDLEPQEECAETPTYEDFPQDCGPIEDDDDEYGHERPRGFVWDVADPFATPQYQEGYDRLLQHFKTLRAMESIGPLEKLPPGSFTDCNEDATSPAVTPTHSSHQSARRGDSQEQVIVSPVQASRCSSCNSWFSQENVGLGPLPSDLEYVDSLLTLDEAEEEARELRRQKRDTLRSRLKKLALLGSEAREAVDGETNQ